MEIREKLNLILTDENVDKSVRDNLLFVLKIIPEIGTMIGFEQHNQILNLDVFEHTLKAMQNSPNDLEIRMALLLHDIGKTHLNQDNTEKRSFIRHQELSEEMSKIILTRLNYDEKFINNVLYLVRTHNDPINVKKLDNSLDMVKKRLDVQFADTIAYNPDNIEKKISSLNEIKMQISQIS